MSNGKFALVKSVHCKNYVTLGGNTGDYISSGSQNYDSFKMKSKEIELSDPSPSEKFPLIRKIPN